MDSDLRYAVDDLTVAHQALEGEVVIVHLTRGHYYSLSATGAETWTALAGGASVGETAAALAAAYEPDVAVLEDAVARFARALVKEGLLEPRSGGGPDGAVAAREALGLNPAARGPYEAPKWTKYTDLEQLLQVDPIHEVDESGWPPAES